MVVILIGVKTLINSDRKLKKFTLSTWVTAFTISVLGGLASLSLPVRAAGTVNDIVVFECGKISTPDRSFWSPGVDVNVKHDMVASCYLIRHNNGLMVWDTGLPAAIASKPDGISIAGGKINLFLDTPFPKLLQEFGVAPEEVKHLALSHMHADHAGNANAFAHATWYVQQAEHEAAFSPLAKKLNFNLKTYNKLAESKTVKLNGRHDIFGDGSVVIIPAPGHTPGHQVLLVNLPSGPVLLSGDLWHFSSNHQFSRVPSFNYDRKQTLESIKSINNLIAATGAKLLIQHDKEQNSQIPHAPKYLR